jgi:hypothetical protein
MSVIHIYRIPQVVELTAPTTGTTLMNYPVNHTDFTLARYVDNEIQFWVKNYDRKAVSLTGSTLTMHISDPKTSRVLLSRDLSVIDATKGLVELFVSGDEAANFPQLSLRYSIVMLRADGVEVMLYTDRDRRGLGNVDVVNGPLPPPIEAIPIAPEDFLQRNSAYYSGAFPGAAAVLNLSGQHSVLLNLTSYTGKFTVQGTLELQPSSTDSDWFNVTSETFVNATEKVHVPFEGNLLWVRFVFTTITGVDVLLYRN